MPQMGGAGHQYANDASGGAAAASVPLDWPAERQARAGALLNTNGLKQVDWPYTWLIGRDAVTLVAPAARDANLPGFIKQPGAGTGQVQFGLAASEPVIAAPKTTAWYVAVFVYLRGNFLNGTFCNAIQLLNGTDSIEIVSSNAGNPGPFFLMPFIGGVAQPTVSCGAVGTPGNSTCPIGAGFTIALYNDPQTGVMGCEFSDVQAFRQQVNSVPNPQVMSLHQYSSDTQALISIGGAFVMKARP